MASTSAQPPTDGKDSAPAQPTVPKVKTEKELEKERKKAAKQAKFEQKNKAKAENAAAPQQAKEKKAKPAKKEEEPLPEYIEDTPEGEKKILKSFEHPHYKAYSAVAVESAWYEWWDKKGYFKPQLKPDGSVLDKGSFVIVHPPPNVTGALHMGHALGDSLQDAMVRWYRMRGYSALWLPGCDHAGIATQSVVERMLQRRENKTRHDLGREKFIERVWEWKEEYHQKINKALTKLGGSFDWEREAFTMSPQLSKAVTEAFVSFHEEGIIYRANRLVNWSTRLSTAVSNLEVNNKELTGRTLLDVPGYDRKVEFGVIVHFKYQIEGSDETIEVATTRIETMLGDTGIAVHPSDKRYSHLVGKNAIHPFLDRKLPIVADEYVDMEFGTGAVKLTPAHDPNDFNLGQKHKLEFINILTDDGLMNENAGPYQGQKRFDVRYKVQDDLKAKGLWVKVEPNPMKVPVCDRSKDIIEPILKPQWWVKTSKLAAAAVEAVKTGEIEIRPSTAKNMFLAWMHPDNIQDWCISRQLWWGHQCPVYHAIVEGEAGDSANNDRWFAGRTEEEARAKAEKALPGKTFKLVRDEDVLDTWFSSGLWPFSTMGWPDNKSLDMERFFPTSVLETGWDIIFFWIARMIMMGIKLTGKVPFKEVFCHSLVRDNEGRKMSKSLGNTISPLDVIAGIKLQDLNDQLLTGNLHPSEVEKATKWQRMAFPEGIPQCGADALRFFMVSSTAPSGGDINLDIKILAAMRRFSNKIWQAGKFVLGKLPEDFKPKAKAEPGVTLAEKWILSKMTTAAKEMNEAMEAREFQKASNLVYQYWWTHLCDVWIENSKSIIQDGTPEEAESSLQTLYTTLEAALLMIHPFMPFISEELWQRLPRRPEDKTESIMLAAYPEFDEKFYSPAAEAAYELVMACSRGARSLMSEYQIKEEGKVLFQALDDTSLVTINKEVSSIKTLCGKGCKEVEVLPPSSSRPAGCVAYPVGSEAVAYLFVKGRVDLDAEIAKAQKKLDKVETGIAKQQKLLADTKYQEKVAASIRESDAKKLADLESEARGFQGTIKQFEQLKLE
ncbi:hypothetical protein BROUX41_000111 [Berkeleyomyces rouxiae]|uniref:uncharacterized protein n=1 Tax=Berkeleyomyces rouxiae TaxID=2035830 RepID=UPI003B7624C8